MKHIIGAFVIGLLVGCTSTEPINGTYIVDAKYTSIHIPEAARSQGVVIDDEDYYIKMSRQVLEDMDEVIEVNYPQWRWSRTKPSKMAFKRKMKKVGEHQYQLLWEKGGELKLTPLRYNPQEEAIYSGPYRYIKR